MWPNANSLWPSVKSFSDRLMSAVIGSTRATGGATCGTAATGAIATGTGAAGMTGAA